jgi:DNA (cytosine-5)-methyltransferase 1
MTLGLKEASRRTGRRLRAVIAADSDPVAAKVFEANHPGAAVYPTTVANVLDQSREEVDILVGGPPCQGHSDFNNHTRREDSKNGLYFEMALACRRFKPRVVIIENVRSVERDKSCVVDRTRSELTRLGYSVDTAILDAADLGLPQRRRRHFLLASLDSRIDPTSVFSELKRTSFPRRTVFWALGDLLSRRGSQSPLDEPARASAETVRRIDYLVAHNLFDLPDAERPRCHQKGGHSYKSVYGRLHWDQPAQTITTGFSSMGQGRFVHPWARRTITAREAARIQTFPDWFEWTDAPKTGLARLIGNAVPPLMMARLGCAILPAL